MTTDLLNEKLRRCERLLEISRTLSSTLDVDTLLARIVTAAVDLTDTEAASILLMSHDGTLRFEATVDPTGFSYDSMTVPLDSSIAGWVVQHSEPLLIDDVRQDPRWSSHVDEQSSFHTRGILAVPLQSHNRMLGCLEALNKRGGLPFSADDVSTLTTLAAQAAVAIENARLFQQGDLIAEMVHELRTPLAAIKATTHILVRPELSEEKREHLIQVIRQETERLTRMTTEFLDLARLESGRTRLQRELVDLPLVLRSAADTVRHQATDRQVGLELIVSPAEGFPILVGDAEKLQQVTLNLLTNAIKYNHEGGQVWLRALYEPGARSVRVEIEDTGMGIAGENLDHMFERFYRVADTEGYTQGSGLGLAIAKNIIEGHAGSIGVTSTPGVGTTFWYTLPVPAA